MKSAKVIIIGGGPAAHSAAIYCARANLEPILFEGMMAGGIAAGGQLTTTTDVENYPGFADGISGPALMEILKKQSIRFGTEIITETIARIDSSKRPFRLWKEWDEEPSYEAQALIIATGATAKKLEFTGSDIFWQKGISACAVCDGALGIFRNQPLAVIGGGDSAAEEATFLTNYAEKVYVIHRRDHLRASHIMQQRLLSNQKIEMLWNSEVIEAKGDKLLEQVILQNTKDSSLREISLRGLFFAIGHKPNTTFLEDTIKTDDDGYIITKPDSTYTNIEGIFAAGDVQDKKYRQAITAAGSGCMAALDAERFLASHS